MQTVPRPDVDELIRGGRELRHRRNRGRIGLAAAVALLVAGGAYGVDMIDSGAAREPAQPAQPSQPTPLPLPMDAGEGIVPGTAYRMLAGVGASGAAIQADLTFGSTSWRMGNFPAVTEGTSSGGVAVYVPTALAAGSGCDGETPEFDVASTAPALARQLSKLPQSTVLQEASSERAFGRRTQHVRLRIDDQCPEDSGYRVAETIRGSHGISYSDVFTEVIIDFWVMEVDGVPVVVDAWHQEIASSQVVDQVSETRDSITFTSDR